MRSKLPSMLCLIVLTVLVSGALAHAQQPTSSPNPQSTPDDEMGSYTVISSLEIGYRGLSLSGDYNKYRSDLNYKAGARIFDSSLLLKRKAGKRGVFDTLLITTTGWGSDPNGSVRVNIEHPRWYRVDGTYRTFKYFRFLNNFANPNWIFNPAAFSRPPNPLTGEHGTDTRTRLGDIDITILPKNERIRFNLGYSPERYGGPAFTNYHIGGNEFMLLQNVRSQANDYRLGADGKLGPIDLSFLYGTRHFRDDTFIDQGLTRGINLNPAVASFTFFRRHEPTRGELNYARLSAHTLIAKKLDITARIIYGMVRSNSTFIENFGGPNFNTRITGAFAPPNTLNLGQYNIQSGTSRPNTLADLGVTYMVTDRLRISNTFRVETFQINGGAIYNAAFFLSRTTAPFNQTIIITDRRAYRTTKYRKVQDTIEGDYQFSSRFSMHLGYRYTSRFVEEIFHGYNLGSNSPTLAPSTDEVDHNHTNAFFGGFKARPAGNWTIYFDAERGTADNIFTRIGNYDYTNIRAKSRYAPNKRLSFNLALITRNNSNPSEIAGVSLQDFGVDVRSRMFTSSLDWTPNSKLSFSTGYNFHWINSDAVVDYFFNSIRHPLGHSQYFVRNHYFFADVVARLHNRVNLFAAYRINKDNGQGNRIADPTGNPGILIASYPKNYQSPEARLAIKLNRWVDWNLGYQYYDYKESTIVGPRPQNYHAHLPYTSLRLYFGRKE